MSKEEYVKFDTAKLLKEKGFDWFTYAYYTKDDVDEEPYFGMENLCPDNWNGTEDEVNDLWFSAPTQQMACHWLYKEKGFYIAILPCEKGFHAMIYHTGVSRHLEYLSLVQDKEHDNPTPQQAIEAALKYCLTKLI